MTSDSAAFFRGGMAMRWAGSVMACIFWMKASEQKGVCPYTIWYRTHPRLHTSDGRPTCTTHATVSQQSLRSYCKRILVYSATVSI